MTAPGELPRRFQRLFRCRILPSQLAGPKREVFFLPNPAGPFCRHRRLGAGEDADPKTVKGRGACAGRGRPRGRPGRRRQRSPRLASWEKAGGKAGSG
jgi:hypothetical protein